jgi:Trk K+ transport system NAD-binding subunit
LKTLVAQVALMFADVRGRQNLRPLVTLILSLVIAVALFSGMFHVIMQRVEGRDHSWFTSIYWTLTTMSTLGFGDITFHSDVGRAFTVVVLLTGLVLLLVVMPFAFIRFFYAPWLEAQLRLRAPREAPLDVTGHVIFCRLDGIALGMIERLKLLEIPYFLLEPDAAVAGTLHADGYSVVLGEVDARKTYEAVRAERARLIVANLGDADNTNITLTVREYDSQVAIAAITEHDDSEDILELAGASSVLALKRKLGEHLAGRVSAGPIQAQVVGRFKSLLIAEFSVHKTPLAGRTVKETRLRELTGLTIVAHWQRGVLLPARGDTVLGDYSVAVVVGTEDQVNELNAMFVIYQPNENPVLVLGGGKVGQAATLALRQRGVAVHLIEKAPAQAESLGKLADKVFVGDAADRRVLAEAGIERAPSVIVTTNDDATNIFLSIYCRRLNPDIHIVSRITHERNLEAIHRAGAQFVLSYNSLGVISLIALLHHREAIVLGEGADLFVLSVPVTLAGQSLADSGIGARTGLHVLAMQHGNETVTSPAASAVLPAGGQLIVIGSGEQRSLFARLFTAGKRR